MRPACTRWQGGPPLSEKGPRQMPAPGTQQDCRTSHQTAKQAESLRAAVLVRPLGPPGVLQASERDAVARRIGLQTPTKHLPKAGVCMQISTALNSLPHGPR